MKPCGACCLRGTPEQCSLETSDDAQSYISQANEIKRLRKEVADLETKFSVKDIGLGEPTGPKSILPARPRPSADQPEPGFRSSFVSLTCAGPLGDLTRVAPCERLSPCRPRTNSDISARTCHYRPSRGPSSPSVCSTSAYQVYQSRHSLTRAALAVPLHGSSTIQIAPPSLSHLTSRAQIEHAKLAHFLDCVSPQPMTGMRSWIRAVVDGNPQSELLGPAMHALSNIFFALQTNDQALLRESQRLHVEALSNLRKDIAEPSTNTAYHALYATMLLVFYEVSRVSLPRPF